MNRGIKNFIMEYGLYFAWIISLISLSGSLFFSEIAGYIPCKLCWFQRIFMYPLSIILGIATFKNDRSVAIYVLPLTVIGGSVSLYHYLIEKVPAFIEITPCTEGIPCNVDYINWFGFVTIPLLALTAFILIFAFTWYAKKSNEWCLACV